MSDRMKFELRRWLSGEIICTAEIEAKEDSSTSLKRGLAARWAFGQKINLRGADLQRADLQGADLQRADLQRADLRGADLQGADLRGADLRGADLQRADLRGADLQGADLQGADLRGASDNEKILLVGERPIIQIGMIGSRKDYLVAYFTERGVLIQAGCWHGSLAEFAERVKEKHGTSNIAKEYAAAIVFIEAQEKIWVKADLLGIPRLCSNCGDDIASTAHPDIVYCAECDILEARGVR